MVPTLVSMLWPLYYSITSPELVFKRSTWCDPIIKVTMPFIRISFLKSRSIKCLKDIMRDNSLWGKTKQSTLELEDLHATVFYVLFSKHYWNSLWTSLMNSAHCILKLAADLQCVLLFGIMGVLPCHIFPTESKRSYSNVSFMQSAFALWNWGLWWINVYKSKTVSQEACLRCNSGMLEPMIYFITMRTREQEENTQSDFSVCHLVLF